jgi:hypothetical protein
MLKITVQQYYYPIFNTVDQEEWFTLSACFSFSDNICIKAN